MLAINLEQYFDPILSFQSITSYLNLMYICAYRAPHACREIGNWRTQEGSSLPGGGGLPTPDLLPLSPHLGSLSNVYHDTCDTCVLGASKQMPFLQALHSHLLHFTSSGTCHYSAMGRGWGLYPVLLGQWTALLTHVTPLAWRGAPQDGQPVVKPAPVCASVRVARD